MPPEPSLSKLHRSTRREDDSISERSSAQKAEVEQKRNRGEASCAECRRLKIKCDKQVPCRSCSRRGCASICPNGSLATGQGTRFVLAATEHLHTRKAILANRVRELEAALSDMQAKHSKETHPLLQSVVAQEQTPPPPADAVPASRIPEPQPKEMLNAFGTLTIADHGLSRYFGPTGGTERLLAHAPPPTTPTETHSPESASSASTPPWQTGPPAAAPSYFSQSFPFSPVGSPAEILLTIKSHLPDSERGWYFCKCYINTVAWTFPGIPPSRIKDVYDVFYSGRDPKETNHYAGPHKIALLFLILAIGALMDLAQRPINEEAEHFFQIARVAVSQSTILQRPSMVSVEAIILLSMYYAMTGADSHRMETSWSLISLASRFALTIGLHRDSARWNLPQSVVERRRALFYSIFLTESWQSLSTGRPPSFVLTYIDCRLPTHYDSNTSPSGLDTTAFKFARDIVFEIACKTLATEAPSYSVIMELDKKLREFHIPDPETMEPVQDEDEAVFALRKCVMLHYKEVMELYIHRSFFAEALMRYPEGPMSSPFSASYLAAYRASKTIAKSVRELFSRFPYLAGRFYQLWTYTFSAAVVFGSIITHSPKSVLAPNALEELESMCKLFSDASVYSRRASRALPIILKLREKGQTVMKNAVTPTWEGESDGPEDELSVLAGRTKLLTSSDNLVETTSNEDLEESWQDPKFPQYSPDTPLPMPKQSYHTQEAYPGYVNAPSEGPITYGAHVASYIPPYAYTEWPLATEPMQPPSAPNWEPSQQPAQIYDAYGRPMIPSSLDYRWNSFMQDSRLFGDQQ